MLCFRAFIIYIASATVDPLIILFESTTGDEDNTITFKSVLFELLLNVQTNAISSNDNNKKS